MKEYVTKSGDMFDLIAFSQLGSEKYTPDLINANREHIATFIFSAGVKLKIPDVDKSVKLSLPPWK